MFLKKTPLEADPHVKDTNCQPHPLEATVSCNVTHQDCCIPSARAHSEGNGLSSRDHRWSPSLQTFVKGCLQPGQGACLIKFSAEMVVHRRHVIVVFTAHRT